MSWLDRDLIVGPYLALVLTEQEFHRAMAHLKVEPADRGKWIRNEHSDATAHFLENPKRELCCIVAVRVNGQTSVQIAGMLVHEAVHIFQSHCERVGEANPSQEFEAYSIQSISQRLMQAYADQIS